MNYDPTEDERLTAYAMGELEGDEARAVEAIIAQRPEAAEHLNQLRATAELVRGELRREAVAMLTMEQRRAIDVAASRPVIFRFRWPLALAASTLLVFGAVLWLWPARGTAPLIPDQGVAVKPTDRGTPPPEELSHPNFIGTAAPDDPLSDLPVELPQPAFVGTPKEAPKGVRMGKLTGHERGPYKLPGSIVSELDNVAGGKPVTSSDTRPIIGDLEFATDGDKRANDGCWVELAPGRQWLQIDLGTEYENFALLIWHHHMETGRVYHDVVVQVSNDPDFVDAVTVFNNDYDNTSGLGEGKDFEYFENFEGLLVPLYDPLNDQGRRFRYIRCWSNGSTVDDANHYTEVEVWGRGVE